MRVLVTGASGFVGSYAVAALLEAGHEPVIFVRNPEKAERVLKRLDISPARRSGVAREVEVREGDIRDAGAVREALEGCDAVLHAAAAQGVTGHAADLHGSNVVGLENVLGQAAELNLDPIVHVSTIAVFVPPTERLITTESPLASPRNGYGQTKVIGERYARSLGGVTIVYPGGVIGPHQPTLDALNEGFRSGLKQGWPIVQGGVCIIDVRDLALALARCFTAGQGARRYLIGGNFLSWGEVATVCEEVTERPVRRLRMPGGVLRGLGSGLDALKKAVKIEYPLTRDAADMMLTMVPTDDAPALKGLGVTLRPVKDSVSDTLRWLAAEGHLDARRIGRLNA